MRAFNLLPAAGALVAGIEARDVAAEALKPALDAVAKAPQPSDAAVEALGEQADALAAVCPLWLASAMR